jgi:hypothetical protein
MSEYPEALIDKVAEAFFNVEVEPQYDFAYLVGKAATNEGDYAEILRDVRAGARAALDALGLREEWLNGVKPAWVTSDMEPAKHRYVTEWENRD